MGKANKQALLTSEEITKLCETAVERFINAERKEKEVRRNNMHHNTKKLLENYRRFKAYIVRATTTLEDVAKEEYPDYSPELLAVFGIKIEDRKAYSVAKSVATMTMLLSHVDRMLEVYRAECMGSDSAVKQRRWDVIDKRYLSGEKRTSVKTLADEYTVDIRVIQDDTKLALEELKVIIFGMDAMIEDLME